MTTTVADHLGDALVLVSSERGRQADIIDAIAEPPVVELDIDGASTLRIVCADPDRKLIRSAAVQTRSWARAAGVHFELVGLAKTGSRYTLTFEDAIVAALRRRTKPLSAPARSTTRSAFARRLAREADVAIAVDPGHPEKVKTALRRSAGGKGKKRRKTNSWDILGADVAEPINWRRFSDGQRLVIGSDAWLAGRSPAYRLTEDADGVDGIDFDLDVGKRVSSATVRVNSGLWAMLPGQPVTLAGVGPADGAWLVSRYSRALTSVHATVTLTRARHELKEPKAPRNPSRGDRGETDYLPNKTGTAPTTPGTTTPGPAPASSARERMVQFALGQNGDAYVWGANGPDSWDCSGLVQGATAAAGKVLTKPSSSQWAQMVAAGVTIPLEQGIATRGAILWRSGHIAISLGNGSTIEAMGTAYGVRYGSATGRFTGAGLWI